MEFLNFLNQQASAIFGILGTILGFSGNYFLQKINQKFEIKKEISKEYYFKKKYVLTEILKMILEYEVKLKTLFDFEKDDNGMYIRKITKEDVYSEYFELIFEYLHLNRLYLEKSIIEILDKLSEFYYLYKLNQKVIDEIDDDVKNKEIVNNKKQLFNNTKNLFDDLINKLKIIEIERFKNQLKMD